MSSWQNVCRPDLSTKLILIFIINLGIWVRHWRDAKKSNREEKEKYGIQISSFEKRKEKCRDLFSGSRREREFLPKNGEILNIFSSFEMRREIQKYFLLFREEKEKFCKQISWFERRSRRRDFNFFVTRKRNPPFPFQFFSSVLKTQNQIFATRGVLTLKSRIKIVCLTIPSPKCNDH